MGKFAWTIDLCQIGNVITEGDQHKETGIYNPTWTSSSIDGYHINKDL